MYSNKSSLYGKNPTFSKSWRFLDDMILEGNQLMDLYRKLFNDNMGESYLERAVRNRLVIELQYDLGMPTKKRNFTTC